MRILITGFDPFGGEKSNPSYEAVRNLPDFIDGYEIIRKEIPTVFYRSYHILKGYLEEYHPDIVLNVGQAGGRKGVTMEKRAYNLLDARIKDNEGNQPKGIRIIPDGEAILCSSLPVEETVNKLKDKGYDIHVSEDAGRFVCNATMYEMLSLNQEYHFRSGFIHVPFSEEQAKEKKDNVPYMKISEMTEILTEIMKTIIEKSSRS